VLSEAVIFLADLALLYRDTIFDVFCLCYAIERHYLTDLSNNLKKQDLRDGHAENIDVTHLFARKLLSLKHGRQ
jgi:hypothetical protein